MVIYIRPNRRAYRTKRIVLRFSTLDSHDYSTKRAEFLVPLKLLLFPCYLRPGFDNLRLHLHNEHLQLFLALFPHMGVAIWGVFLPNGHTREYRSSNRWLLIALWCCSISNEEQIVVNNSHSQGIHPEGQTC